MVRIGFVGVFIIQAILLVSSGCAKKEEVEKNKREFSLPVQIGKVIFKDWPSTIDAILEHFNNPEGIPGFGDWSSIINDLDPFRDGMAAYRMGTYLQCLIEDFENNLDREVIMANAAERYKKQWGADKVITS